MAGYTTLPTLQPSLGCGGGPIPMLRFWENNYGLFCASSTSQQFSSVTYSQFSVQMVNIPMALSLSKAQMIVRNSAGGAIDNPGTYSASMGFYTKTGNTYTLINSAQFEGNGQFGATGIFLGNFSTSESSLSAGNYWIGVFFKSSTTATTQNFTLSAAFNVTLANFTDNPPFFICGSSSTTLTSLPASFASTDFVTNDPAAWLQPYILITG